MEKLNIQMTPPIQYPRLYSLVKVLLCSSTIFDDHFVHLLLLFFIVESPKRGYFVTYRLCTLIHRLIFFIIPRFHLDYSLVFIRFLLY